jgi:hypothetical protein
MPEIQIPTEVAMSAASVAAPRVDVAPKAAEVRAVSPTGDFLAVARKPLSIDSDTNIAAIARKSMGQELPRGTLVNAIGEPMPKSTPLVAEVVAPAASAEPVDSVVPEVVAEAQAAPEAVIYVPQRTETDTATGVQASEALRFATAQTEAAKIAIEAAEVKPDTSLAVEAETATPLTEAEQRLKDRDKGVNDYVVARAEERKAAAAVRAQRIKEGVKVPKEPKFRVPNTVQKDPSYQAELAALAKDGKDPKKPEVQREALDRHYYKQGERIVEDGVPNEILTSEVFRKTFGNLSKAARESLSLKPDQDLPADVMRNIYARAIAAELENKDRQPKKSWVRLIAKFVAILGLSFVTELTKPFRQQLAEEAK